MGDMGDYWRDVKPDMKERSQRKRAANRKSGAAILHAAGVPFEAKSGGAHLIVQAGDHVVDYWPGTGKWATRDHQFSIVGRGIAGLMQHIKGQKS